MSFEDDLNNLMSGTSTQGEPSVADTSSYTSVASTNIYKFMDDSYHGTGGFRDGSYLVPHDREMFYESRRANSFYKNFVKPIVTAMVAPVFNAEIDRTVADDNGNEITDKPINAFIGNCDNRGTSLHSFMEMASIKCGLHGLTFIVMDNFRELPMTEADVLADRKFPYIYLRTVRDLKSWKIDQWGNLKSITFEDIPVVVKSDDKEEEDKRCREWTETEVIVYRKNDEGAMEVVERYEHGLGRIPVVSMYCVKPESGSIEVDPPLYDLARLNHAIFNKDSEVRDLERSQGFAIMYIQTDDPENFTVSNHNAIFIGKETNITPGFMSPDPRIMDGLQKNIDTLREDLFRIAEQNGVKGVQSAKSGLALQWEFTAQEALKKRTSYIAKTTEEAIVELFQVYTNTEYSYIADYPFDFQPNNFEAELKLMDNYMLLEGLPSSARALALTKVTRFLFADQEPEQVAIVIDDINRGVEDERQSNINVNIDSDN